MKKNLTSSSYQMNRVKNLPQIQASNINLSINNTFVLIRNNTQENLSLTKKDNLPNIFSYSYKKNKTKISPLNLKKTKTKFSRNIHTLTLKRKSSQKSENEINPLFELMMSNKILGQLLYFFNMRELLNLMNINKKIHTFIKNTDVFKKYIDIKNDIKNGNLFKDIKKDKISKIIKYNFRNSSRNISYQISTQSTFLNNFNHTNNSEKINSFLKFNLLTKNKLKLSKKINPKITKEIPSLKLKLNIPTLNNNHIDNFLNSVLSYKTSSSKHKSQTKDTIPKKGDNEIFLVDELNMKKLKVMFLSLIKNNGNKMQLLMKKYKLNFIETKLIFNGIIESLILKIMKENDNNEVNIDSLILQRINPDKFLDLYIDPILNLNYITIRKINFDNVIIPSLSLIKKISNLIYRNLDNIKIISFQNNYIGDTYAKILFKSLRNNQNLSILNLDHNQISAKGIKYIESFLKNNSSLNTLVLSYNYLSTNGSNILLNYLKENKNSNLKTLDLSYNGIGKNGIESLVEYIKSNKKLISLFFSGNCLGNEALYKFSNLLFVENKNHKKVKLSYLDISNNSFTKKSYIYINNIIFYSSFISSINISYNNLYNEGVSNIFSCINKQSKLISLDLSRTNLDEKSIEFISKKIDKNIVLRILNLSYNNLNRACIYIKNLLNKESNLKVLKLISCKLSQESNLIFQGLSNNNDLQTFDISNNYLLMDYDFVIDLYSFFKNNKKLNNLIMDNNNIDDIKMNYISKFIEENKSLKFISLKDNKITNQSAFSLLNSLQKNENIRKIGLEGNSIETGIKQQIYILLNEKLNININKNVC